MVIVNQFWYSLDDSNTLPEFALEMMEHNKKKVDIHLWTYQKLKNVPSGVKMRNASEIVPYSFFKEKVLKYTKQFDAKISETYVWPKVSLLIKKYEPFLDIDVRAFRMKTLTLVKELTL